MYSLKKCLLNNYYIPGTLLDTGDKTMSKIGTIHALWNLQPSRGGKDINLNKNNI